MIFFLQLDKIREQCEPIEIFHFHQLAVRLEQMPILDVGRWPTSRVSRGISRYLIYNFLSWILFYTLKLAIIKKHFLDIWKINIFKCWFEAILSLSFKSPEKLLIHLDLLLIHLEWCNAEDFYKSKITTNTATRFQPKNHRYFSTCDILWTKNFKHPKKQNLL